MRQLCDVRRQLAPPLSSVMLRVLMPHRRERAQYERPLPAPSAGFLQQNLHLARISSCAFYPLIKRHHTLVDEHVFDRPLATLTWFKHFCIVAVHHMFIILCAFIP